MPTKCNHKKAYFFHNNAPKYCPDCNNYIDGNIIINIDKKVNYATKRTNKAIPR